MSRIPTSPAFSSHCAEKNRLTTNAVSASSSTMSQIATKISWFASLMKISSVFPALTYSTNLAS